jgi:serine/threonine-protein kinase HipA
MAELWRRIVFSIMISNTDDHLRNHGFLYKRYKGWRLSPVYDLNPIPLDIKPRILTTTIHLDDASTSLETALDVAKDFRLSKNQAQQIIKDVALAVAQWRQVASALGLSKRECDRMASAFDYNMMQ